MSSGVIELIVGANCTVQPVEVWVNRRAVFTLPVCDVINLLARAILTLQVSEIPILGVLTKYTNLSIPVHVGSGIARTFLECPVVGLAIGATVANTICLVLSLWAV